MPSFCCVVNCGSTRSRDENVKFFRIPAILHFKHKTNLNELSAKRRQKWLNAIKRADFPESKQKDAVVCSRHFISGKPAEITDELNPDWAPSVNMGYDKTLNANRMERFERKRKRLAEARAIEETANMTSCSVSSCTNYRRSAESRKKDISYHRFPKIDNMREKWIEAIYPRKTITDNSYVCSVHFLKDDFERNLQAELLSLPNRRRLKPTAVPSLHLDVSDEWPGLAQDKVEEISPFIKYSSQESTENAQNITSGPDIKYKAIIQRINTIERQNHELLSSQKFVVNRKPIPILYLGQNTEENEALLDIDSKTSTIAAITSNLTDDVINTERIKEDPECFLDESISTDPEISQDVDKQTDADVLKCRTCLDVIETQGYHFVTIMGHLTKTIKEMIIFCVPQMASTLSDDDVVCDKCLDAIQFCVKFIESCLEVEDKLQSFDKQENYDENDDNNLPHAIEYIDHDYVIKSESEETETCQNTGAVQPSILENLLLNHRQPIDSNSEEDFKSDRQIFKGPSCDKILKSHESPVNHIITVHNNLMPFNENVQKDPTVSNSNQGVNTQLEEFLQITDRERFKCLTCAKLFKTENYLLVHSRRVHDVLKRPIKESNKKVTKVQRTPKYVCKFCECSFVRVGSYRRHLKKHNENKSDVCKICGLKFHSKQELSEHRRQHGIVCSICFERFSTRQEINEHRQVHPDIFFCRLCGKGFRMRKSLSSHISQVHNPYNFHCTKCGKVFKSKKLLRYHEIIHDPEKKLKCDKCPSTFQDKSKLKLHQRVIHEKIKEFQCNKCDRKFGLKISLKYHIRRTHLKLKAYQCENCGKRFGRRDNFQIHKLRHCKEAKKEHLMQEAKLVGSEELEMCK